MELRKQFIDNFVFPLGPVLLVLIIIISKCRETSLYTKQYKSRIYHILTIHIIQYMYSINIVVQFDLLHRPFFDKLT